MQFKSSQLKHFTTSKWFTLHHPVPNIVWFVQRPAAPKEAIASHLHHLVFGGLFAEDPQLPEVVVEGMLPRDLYEKRVVEKKHIFVEARHHQLHNNQSKITHVYMYHVSQIWFKKFMIQHVSLYMYIYTMTIYVMMMSKLVWWNMKSTHVKKRPAPGPCRRASNTRCSQYLCNLCAEGPPVGSTQRSSISDQLNQFTTISNQTVISLQKIYKIRTGLDKKMMSHDIIMT